MTKGKISQKLSKVNEQLEILQAKQKELERQKQEAEDAESLKIIRRYKISSEQLQLLNQLSEEEISMLLEEKRKKEKETFSHEEIIN